MIKAEKLFSEADKKRLADAVRAAEKNTSGEIVPFVAAQSDSYPEAWLRSGTLAAFLLLFIFGVVNIGSDTWLPVSIGEIVLFALLAFAAAGLAATYLPMVKRMFIPAAMMQQRVDERASMAFLEEEVFATRERTGILIFISLFEHRVRILGDSGINEKVEQAQWDDIVATIVQAMKAGQPADGLHDAIEQCGALLGDSGVEIRPDDTDELDNAVRFSDK